MSEFKKKERELSARYEAGQRNFINTVTNVGKNRAKRQKRAAHEIARAVRVASFAVARASGHDVGRAPKLKRYA